jgi:uncharacterized protein YjeT (DUF2065 family)
MNWQIIVTAMGLLLVVEGILPFSAPHLWRRIMQQIFIQSDRALHIMGLASMLIGLFLVCVARDLY